MAYWLVKTEPSGYSWDDLVREKRAVWDGVAHPTALRHLRAMGPGDEVLVYHTGAEKRIVGIARVAREAYPDPKGGGDSAAVVDLVPVRPLERPVTLAEVKASGRFADWELTRLPRLSVMPVKAEHWRAILGWR
jgi:predicted RNA-binding protein with PUA-like domain